MLIASPGRLGWKTHKTTAFRIGGPLPSPVDMFPFDGVYTRRIKRATLTLRQTSLVTVVWLLGCSSGPEHTTLEDGGPVDADSRVDGSTDGSSSDGGSSDGDSSDGDSSDGDDDDADITPALPCTHFVDESRGDDTNPGTDEEPWSTIGHAAANAAAGNVVCIRQGVYAEHVELSVSGEVDRPIVFQGERGSAGEWLSIVDPGVPATGWEPAPEVGSGVYKTTGLDFNPQLMVIVDVSGPRQLARINDRWMTEPTMGGTGFDLLSEPADALHTTQYLGMTIGFWDGIEAFYGYLDGITYIRFRDGDDPNDMELRASDGGAGFRIQDQSDIVIRDLWIRAQQYSIVIEGDGATRNVIENNQLMHGRGRVLVRNGASENHIRDNQMTLAYFGYDDPGAWSQGSEDRHGIREYIYLTFKLRVGESSSDDHGVYMLYAGDGNEVYRNEIFRGLLGVGGIGNVDAPTRNLRVYENIIHNMSSVGIITSEALVDAEYSDNLIYDCNINIRLHHVNHVGDEGRIYVYNNRLWNPSGVGSGFYVHHHEGGPHREMYIYHNSVAGGGKGFDPGAAMSYGGLLRTYFLNNVFSSPMPIYVRDFITAEGMIGGCGYNWLGGSRYDGVPLPVWCTEGTINAEGEYLWDNSVLPDFVLHAGCEAIASGLDLSASFELGGQTYELLPGMVPGYFEGARPNMGAP